MKTIEQIAEDLFPLISTGPIPDKFDQTTEWNRQRASAALRAFRDEIAGVATNKADRQRMAAKQVACEDCEAADAYQHAADQLYNLAAAIRQYGDEA